MKAYVLMLYLILLFAPVQSYANNVYAIFGNFGRKCTYVNFSFINCSDATPIKISVSIYTHYPYYYGNFTAFPLNTTKEGAVESIFGGICTLPSSGTAICTVNYAPFSVYSGNGTYLANISLKLVSNLYRQIVFNYSTNVTIYHYITPEEESLVNDFLSLLKKVDYYNDSYIGFCSNHHICNNSVNSSIQNMVLLAKEANESLENSSLSQAYSYIFQLNGSIGNFAPIFSSFYSFANTTISLVNEANGNVNASRSIYAGNLSILSNCTYSRNETYKEAINSSISFVSSFSNATNPEEAEQYLNLSKSLLKNETLAIRKCSLVGKTILLPHFNIPQFNFSEKGIFEIGIGIVLIIGVAVGISRLLEHREFMKIKNKGQGSEKEEEEKGEESEEKEGDLDKWIKGGGIEEKGI
ncbi:MAG: hypothetical protein QXL16_00255 [Candidatus Micrarchaeaceae archaeon]